MLPALATAVSAQSNALLHVLLALAVVIIAGRALGWLLAWFGQPPVIGEVLAGIAIGPSLLGRLWPESIEHLLPAEDAPYLALLANFGIVLYMFTVGLEFDAAVFRRHGRAALAISQSAIIVPLALGAMLAWVIYPILAPDDVTLTVFALFMGISMSVTAFPVLARILSDTRLHRTDLGTLALACAAIGDVTAWCLLAFVVGVAQAKLGGAIIVSLFTLAYVGLMFLVVRPLIARWMPRDEAGLTPDVVAATFLALLISAWLTEAIGIHALFGAFLIGAVIPHDSVVARQFSHKLQDLVAVVLLPAFFALTGMRTEISLISGWNDWLWCGVIIAVATAGKFGGSLLAARASGQTWRDSAALGVLMNTRGLMELIVLNIGLDLKVISPRLFAMMVLMALVTTLITTPLLRLLGVTPEVGSSPAQP